MMPMNISDFKNEARLPTAASAHMFSFKIQAVLRQRRWESIRRARHG